MSDSEVTYLGRTVSKEGFRVFVYGKDGKKKLVNSWDEFMKTVHTGEWFLSPEEVQIHQELQELKKEQPELKKNGRKKASE